MDKKLHIIVTGELGGLRAFALSKSILRFTSYLLIIAFGVVIIGGLGSLPGTFLGGLVLGVSQLFGGRILGPGFQLLSGYIILLIILTLRPQGILGGR